ncbi:MAG: SusD/RagB family nutrient-binding outer membrane lipoprotein [Terrimonas sp.]|nr:SusD/RagB family nutrient-binding outer membrane lipoprotein [Terrimonas sp.]OJY87703.1 MAG: hypothetical protein BGP13_04515 [Sphingobacteriales bacterium 40-81]
MKKFKTYIYAVIIGCTMGTSCTKDFQEKNANPNAINDVTPDLLMPTIIRSICNEMVNQSWGIGNIVIQHTAKIQFVSEDRYTWGDRSGLFSNMYGNMRDVERLIALGDAKNVPNYKAVGLVLKAWMYSLVTDAYGDVPYSEAMNGVGGILMPKYDSQESIYNGILSDLATANTTFNSGAGTLVGDILFNGDLTKWKKLANSLQLRCLMRISNKRNVAADMQAIIGGANTPVFESNTDNAALTYLTVSPNQFPLHTTRSGSFDEFRLSKTLGDKLLALGDTRIAIFAQKADATGTYVGVPNGLNEVDALAYNGGPNNVSRVGSYFFLDAITETGLKVAKGYIMGYPELQFILAEAVQKGMVNTGNTAQWHYEEGIKSSFSYFQSTMPAGYLTQAGVAFNNTDALTLIGTQKWIALFFGGLEAWFDWRRTNIPALVAGRDNVNNDRIPVRFAYPRSEQTLNSASRTAAVSAQGWSEDTYNQKVWWDE